VVDRPKSLRNVSSRSGSTKTSALHGHLQLQCTAFVDGYTHSWMDSRIYALAHTSLLRFTSRQHSSEHSMLSTWRTWSRCMELTGTHHQPLPYAYQPATRRPLSFRAQLFWGCLDTTGALFVAQFS
jgi:hypothetical protein